MTKRITVLATSSAAASSATPILDISGESVLGEPNIDL